MLVRRRCDGRLPESGRPGWYPRCVANPRMTAEIGRVLGGRYRLVAPIGMGASAQVFLADDVRLRRRVAVKMLHDALAGDSEFLRRFAAEARAAAALNHPNVMAVYDWGDDEVAFIVTEYLSGGSLRSLLDHSGVLSPSQALTVGLDATRALDYAHRRGFVHRDIKPANLLFGDDQRLRIADFGLARALAEAAWTEPQGAVLGTARYASPEQAKGETLTGKADVYSLALVLIEAVTGQVPFVADTTLGTLMARVDRQLEVPDELGPLADVLTRAGHPDPAERIDSRTFAAGLLRAAKALPRPMPLPLAGALSQSGAATADVDPTVHGPLTEVVGVAVASAAAASASSLVGDRSGLTPDDLDLDPPDWVSRSEPTDVTALGLIDPEPERETVVVDLRGSDADPAPSGSVDDGDEMGENGAGSEVATDRHDDLDDASDGSDPSDEDQLPDEDGVTESPDPAGSDSDSDVEDVADESEREPALVAAAPLGAVAEPAWADGTIGGVVSDPVDRIVDPTATALIPPVRIDDFAYPDAGSVDLNTRTNGVIPPTVDVGGSDGRRRRRWPWAVAAVVLLAGGGGVAAATIVNRDAEPPAPLLVLPLPDLVNRSIDEARAVTTAAGWKVAPAVEVRRDNTMKGQVLESAPLPGERLRIGQTVTFTVSAGQEIYPVPLDQLNGVSVEAATEILDGAQFVANPQGGRSYHEDVPEGDVISAVDGTGARAERGSSIGLLISDGPEPRVIPAGLVGGTQSEAKAALEALQLVMAPVGTFSDTIPEGQVISVLPRSGATAERGSVVSVEVSRGPELRAVPDISGADDLGEAVAILTNAGFKAGEARGPASGRPRRTTPAAGTMVRPGTTINIILG